MSSTPDARLLEAHDLALAALREITADATIGPAAGYVVEDDDVVSLRFENRLGGYPGWFWTVSVARVEGEEPTVLEAGLLPGDGALLAPDWVPWAERLAEYRAQQVAAAAEQAEAQSAESADDGDADDADDDLDDLDDIDALDFDEDGSPLLHSGDVDGVDIDELDVSDDEDDDTEDDGDDTEDEPDSDDDGDAEDFDEDEPDAED